MKLDLSARPHIARFLKLRPSTGAVPSFGDSIKTGGEMRAEAARLAEEALLHRRLEGSAAYRKCMKVGCMDHDSCLRVARITQTTGDAGKSIWKGLYRYSGLQAFYQNFASSDDMDVLHNQQPKRVVTNLKTGVQLARPLAVWIILTSGAVAGNWVSYA